MPLTAPPPTPPAQPVLQSLLAAEHAFARDARQRGTGPAFVAVYHPEGLIFAPKPVPGGPYYAAKPQDGSQLLWGPAAAWASRGGDLGFTTGPWTWHPGAGEPAQAQGWFVSVWVREGEGPWKLLWDLGTPNPPEPRAPALLPDSGKAPAGRAPGPGTPEALLDVDRAFAREAADSPKRAYAKYGSRELRLHRKGVFPAVGLQASLDLIQAVGASRTWTPEAGRVSASGDLGCTRGTLPDGAYVRLWKREGQAWKLLLDVEVES